MSHRAQQVVDAAAAALAANAALLAAVFTERSISLGEPDGEVPAVNVSPGADTALGQTGTSNLSFIDSELQLDILVVARAADEPTLLAALMELRRQVHIAMFTAPNRDLGLAFVFGVRYGGADAPKFDSGGTQIAGALACRWSVLYRMNLTDPA